MKRRQVLRLGGGATALVLAGCVGGPPPDLRVRNVSAHDHTVEVRVRNQGQTLLSQSFSVPAKANGEEQGTVEEVYPGPGTYTITGEIVGGETKRTAVELDTGSPMMTHVTVTSDETLAIGRLAP